MATIAAGAPKTYFEMVPFDGGECALNIVDYHIPNGAENLLRVVHHALKDGNYYITNNTGRTLAEVAAQVVTQYDDARGIIRRIIDCISRCFGCTPTIDQLKTWEHEIGEMEKDMIGEYPRSFFAGRLRTIRGALGQLSKDFKAGAVEFNHNDFYADACALNEAFGKIPRTELSFEQNNKYWDTRALFDRLLFVCVQCAMDQKDLKTAAQFLCLIDTFADSRHSSEEVLYGTYGSARKLANTAIEKLAQAHFPAVATLAEKIDELGKRYPLPTGV